MPAIYRVIEVVHVNRASFESDRRLNEYGSKAPAEEKVVGRLTVLEGELPGRVARSKFPAPEGWFTTYRIIDADGANLAAS